MFKIRRFFEILFDDPAVSSEEFRSFVEDHLGKLAGRAEFAAMLAATRALFTPFDAALSARAQEIGSLGGNTVTKNQLLQLFRTKIRQRRGRVVDMFGEESPEYREIFKEGLGYYTKATMETIAQRLDYAVEKFTKYQAKLGADLVVEFTQLRTDFNGARDEQVGDKGSVSAARGAVKETRTALEKKMMENVLTLALKYLGQPEKAAEFFDQSKLEDPTQSQATDAVKPATP